MDLDPSRSRSDKGSASQTPSPPKHENEEVVQHAAPVRRRSVVEFENKEHLRAALVDCTRRGSSCLIDGSDSASLLTDDPDWLKSNYEDDAGSSLNLDGLAEGPDETIKGSKIEENLENNIDVNLADDNNRKGDLSWPELSSKMDWVTDNMDPLSSLPQTYDDEANRLLVLKSYLLLDSNREASFERITALASRIFDVPISLVSLVDIGRQWFMSNRGLGDVRETPRKLAFCAHAIQSTNDLLIVPDAPADPRFTNNDLVTGAPHIRFYAGAPLICPEGYRLGTLCIIDTKTRPQGLTMPQRQTLRELSALVVEEMVRRRDGHQRSERETSRTLAETASDLLVPLRGASDAIQSLFGEEQEECKEKSELKGDESYGTEHRSDVGKVATTCLDIMGRICERAINSYEADHSDRRNESCSATKQGAGLPLSSASNSSFDDFNKEEKDYDDTLVNISNLADNLRTVMVGHQSNTENMIIPITISVDDAVPPEIISDEVKIFRSSLNFLRNALDRIAERDNNEGKARCRSVNLRFYVKRKNVISVGPKMRKAEKKEKCYLVCECEDTGPVIKPEKVDELFQGLRTSNSVTTVGVGTGGFGLLPVVDAIKSLSGKFGYKPKEGWKSMDPPVGAIFWFAVPLVVPFSREDRREDQSPSAAASPTGSSGKIRFGGPNSKKKKMLSFTSSNSFDNDKVFDAVSKAMAEAANCYIDSDQEDDLVQEPGNNGPKKKVLIIDDSPVVRDTISRSLAKLGFIVETASDGMEGLSALQASQYDVVFCDFLMPVYDGPDCIEQYRAWEAKHRPGGRQRIVGLSDSASEEDTRRGADAGMDGLVSKSAKLADILSEAIKISSNEGGSSSGQSRSVPTIVLDDRSGIAPAAHNLPRMPPSCSSSLQSSGGPMPLTSVFDGVFGNSSLSSVATHQAYSELTRSAVRPNLSLPSSLLRDTAPFRSQQSQSAPSSSSTTSPFPSLAARDMAEAPRPLPLQAQNTPGLECLLVVDRYSTLRVLTKAVEAKGWKARAADDGNHGLSLLKAQRWSAVIVGGDMQDLPGPECIVQFREWEAGHRKDDERQRNVYFLQQALNGMNPDAMPPTGFDGILSQAVNPKDVATLLDRGSSVQKIDE